MKTRNEFISQTGVVEKAKWLFPAFMALALAAALFGVTGCGKSEQSAGQTQYTCSMHPEVVKDQPGKCSKCGMALIEKK